MKLEQHRAPKLNHLEGNNSKISIYGFQDLHQFILIISNEEDRANEKYCSHSVPVLDVMEYDSEAI